MRSDSLKNLAPFTTQCESAKKKESYSRCVAKAGWRHTRVRNSALKSSPIREDEMKIARTRVSVFVPTDTAGRQTGDEYREEFRTVRVMHSMRLVISVTHYSSPCTACWHCHITGGKAPPARRQEEGGRRGKENTDKQKTVEVFAERADSLQSAGVNGSNVFDRAGRAPECPAADERERWERKKNGKKEKKEIQTEK